MAHWAYDSIFYHIYPLGLCGAPPHNDFSSPAVPRLEKLSGWLDHIAGIGANALYLGPVFESTAHGYDTVDYYHVDRRLGTNETLKQFSAALHARGMRLVLDGVFNHVGRNFWAFYDVLTKGEGSAYIDWFYGLQFGPRSPYGDPFTYEGWNGHHSLVKLNLHNPAVKDHIFRAVAMWIDEFDIDGLRLDAADHIDLGFLRELAAFCRDIRPDFWLMGEVVHGDYRQWANPDTLNSVTNYECYKGLYSSHLDKNYFEIAYALNRQFGEGGIYAHLPLYNFADNHDVNRVASNLTNPAHLYPLYALLFTMPGVPSVYYGSEWGFTGRKQNGNDYPLRPDLDLDTMVHTAPRPDLAGAIARFAQVRHRLDALRHGGYRQLSVGHQHFAFMRELPGELVVVMLNAAGEPASFDLQIPSGRALIDLLNEGESYPVDTGRAHIDVPPCWARIMLVQNC